MNKHGEKFIFRGLFVTVLVLGLSLTTYFPVQAAEVEEKNLSTLPASSVATPVATPEATPKAMGPTAASPSQEAKEDFSTGFKGVGSGFKNGVKATGRGFKTAGKGIGHGFKKFGSLVKGIFVRDKNKNEVQEKNLAAEGTNLAEENSALEAEEDLDSVGNEDYADEV